MFMAGNGMYGTPPSSSITVTGLMPSHSEEVYTIFNHNCVSTPLPLGFFRSEDPTNYPLKTGPDAESSFKQHTICPFENSEASELPSKPVPARTSSKRSRAAAVHNLSEKRRRSKINEEIKALQNLIPNSNKTDKASILDDAIEYLKQLQLHVQILMMRNGLSSYPMCLSGGLQPMILPQTELNFNEGNEFQNCISGIASSADAESLVQPALSFSKHCSFSNQSVVIPLVTNITTSDTSSSFHPSVKDALW